MFGFSKVVPFSGGAEWMWSSLKTLEKKLGAAWTFRGLDS